MRHMYSHPRECRKIFLGNYLCIGFVPGGNWPFAHVNVWRDKWRSWLQQQTVQTLAQVGGVYPLLSGVCHFLSSWESKLVSISISINQFINQSINQGKEAHPQTTHPSNKRKCEHFSELFVQSVLSLSFRLSRRHAERVWANYLRKLFLVGFYGVGGFWRRVSFPWINSGRFSLPAQVAPQSAVSWCSWNDTVQVAEYIDKGFWHVCYVGKV